jgi:hypothetical protein
MQIIGGGCGTGEITAVKVKTEQMKKSRNGIPNEVLKEIFPKKLIGPFVDLAQGREREEGQTENNQNRGERD